MKTIKAFFAIFCLTICLTLGLTACSRKCEHNYDNNCDAICNDCEEPREVSAHQWKDADCDSPKTCTVCALSEGSALGHIPAEDDGDCTTAVKCTRCDNDAVPAKENHTPAEDDGDCTTAVKCTECDHEVISAQMHLDDDKSGQCDSPGCEHTFVYATVTGLEFYGDAVTLEGNTYTVTIPYGEFSVAVGIRVTGTNLGVIIDECLFEHEGKIGEDRKFTITAAFEKQDDGSIYYEKNYIDTGLIQIGPSKIYYSNDDGVTWVDTGYVMVVVEESDPTEPDPIEPDPIVPPTENEPQISGIEFYGDAVTLEGNTYTVTIPHGENFVAVSVRARGTNLGVIVDEWLLTYSGRIGEDGGFAVNAAYEKAEDGSISFDEVYVNYNSIETSPNKIYYSNDGGTTWVDTGYVMVVVEASA